jgi:hypothetical protein
LEDFSIIAIDVIVKDTSKLHVDAQGEVMARKDLDKETERPRYYSQFWLDIAAGRRVIGAERGVQDNEEAEALETEQTPEGSTKGLRGARGATPAPMVEAEPVARQPLPPLKRGGAASLDELAAAAGLVDVNADEEEAPELEGEEVTEELEPFSAGTHEVDEEVEPEEESYGYAELYEEDDEEEEEDWPPSRRGKKHTTNKKPDKPRRRERGRDF